jgi:hypothetical protein
LLQKFTSSKLFELEELVNEIVDILLYIQDLFLLENIYLNRALSETIMEVVVIPVLIPLLSNSVQEIVSKMFLFNQTDP